MSAKFVNISNAPDSPMEGWTPIVVKKAEIDAEIERLAKLPSPANGIRAARIAHPMATGRGLGMSPGIDITLHVLKAGESTLPVRNNSSQVSICIQGVGSARIGARSFSMAKFDVWNTPAMHPYMYRNEGTDTMVRLTYSNRALLENLLTHYVETLPADWFEKADALTGEGAPAQKARELPAPIQLTPEGAQLLMYEHLISPEVVDNKALLWPWKLIEQERERIYPAGALANMGRRGLFVLFNPATGRTKGATHSFFATIGFMPANVIDFPHRHSSNAINYAIAGGFISDVNGQRVKWDEGDIAYTAPGWSAHANGSEEKGGIALTIQDHPFQIATECLVWQEGEGKPIRLLGSEQGFQSDDSIRLAKAN